MGTLKFEATLDNGRFLSGVAQMQDGIKDLTKDAETAGASLDDILGKAKGLAAVSFAGISIKGFVDKMVEVRGYFQDINSSMKTFLGSQEKADEFTEKLSKYAYWNMFEFSDLAKASQQLIAYGNDVDNIIGIIDKLSNVASGTGASLEEMIGLYNRAKSTGSVDSQAMQSWATRGLVIRDVLKEMGREASATSVSFEDLNAVLSHVTGEGGMFHDLMLSQMDNINASIGQLEDDLTSMYNEVGELMQGSIKDAIDFVDQLVKNYQKVGATLVSVISTYGAYRAALIATATIQNLKTLSTIAATKAEFMYYVQTEALIKAQKLLNVTMLSNPWVAAAVGIGAAVTSLIAFSDWTTTAEKEEERLSNRTEEQKEANSKYKESIDKLHASIIDETESETNRQKAFDELKKKMPKVFDDYATYIQYANNAAEAVRRETRAINERNAALGRQNVEADKSTLETLQKIKALRDEFGSASSGRKLEIKKQIQSLYHSDAFANLTDKEQLMAKTGGIDDLIKGYVKTVKSEYAELAKSANAAYEAALGSKTKYEIGDDIARYNEIIKNAKEKGITGLIKLADEELPVSLEDLKARVDAAQKQWTKIDQTSSEDFVETAKKNYEKAQKNLQEIYNSHNDRNRFSTKEAYETALKAAKRKVEETKAAYENLLPSKDTSSKQDKAYNEMAKKRQKFNELVSKYDIEGRREHEDNMFAMTQAEIDIMEDGSKKSVAQEKLNFEKRKAELERGYADLKNQKIQRAKELYEIQNKDSVFTYDENDEKWFPTEEETALFEAQMKALVAQSQKAVSDLHAAEVQNMVDYLRQYGTATQQKFAIEKEYQMKISKEQDKWVKKRLEEERDAALNAVDANELLANIDMASVFDDFGLILAEPLKDAVQNLRDFVKTDEFKSLDPSDQKVYYDAINTATEKLGGTIEKLDFKGTGEAIDRYKAAIVNLNNAKESEKKVTEAATKEVEKFDKWLKEHPDATIEERVAAESAKAAAEMARQFAGERTQEAQQEVNDATADASDKLTGFTQSLKGVDSLFQAIANGSGKALWDVLGLELQEEVGNSVAKALGKAFEGRGDLVSMIIGAILSILDVLKDEGIGGLVEGLIDSILGAIDKIISNILSGQFIGQILGAVYKGVASIINTITRAIGNVLTLGLLDGGVFDWIGLNGESDETYADDMKRLANSNESLEDAISSLSDIMKSQSIAESMDTHAKIMEDISKKQMNLQEMLDRSGKAYSNGTFGIGGDHSSNYYVDRNMGKDDWAEVSKQVGKAIKSADDFWNLTSEEMWKVATYASTQYAKIKTYASEGHADASQYMDEYISLWQKADDALEEYNEKLTNTSFDSVRSDFKSKLMDMEADTEDFGEAFEDIMKEAVVESLMLSTYDEQLKEWYNDFADMMKTDSTIDETEKQILKDKWDGIMKDALAERDELAKTLGWDTNSYSQEASKRGFATMSQDTGEELNGRFTALQISNEGLLEKASIAVERLVAIADIAGEANVILGEMREMMAVGNLHLEDMVKYSKSITQILDDNIGRIASKLDTL